MIFQIRDIQDERVRSGAQIVFLIEQEVRCVAVCRYMFRRARSNGVGQGFCVAVQRKRRRYDANICP